MADPQDITLFTAVDRTKEPDFFKRFLDRGNKLPGIVASKPVILAGRREVFVPYSPIHALLLLPAIAVFIWLPLFALGILAIRAFTPLSWLVAKAQWALREGDKDPLKAIGYVAAVAVFAISVGLRAILAA